MTHKSRLPVTARERSKRDVLRMLKSIENIHRLRQIGDAAPNMAALKAIKALEAIKLPLPARTNVDASD